MSVPYPLGTHTNHKICHGSPLGSARHTGSPTSSLLSGSPDLPRPIVSDDWLLKSALSICASSHSWCNRYSALQLGAVDKKLKRANRPTMGHFTKAGTLPKRHVVCTSLLSLLLALAVSSTPKPSGAEEYRAVQIVQHSAPTLSTTFHCTCCCEDQQPLELENSP